MVFVIRYFLDHLIISRFEVPLLLWVGVRRELDFSDVYNLLLFEFTLMGVILIVCVLLRMFILLMGLSVVIVFALVIVP